MNTQRFPDFGNGWDSLSDAYLAAGYTAKTIIVWQAAIEKENLATKNKLNKLVDDLDQDLD